MFMFCIPRGDWSLRWQTTGLLCLVFALPASWADTAPHEVENKVSSETVDFSDFLVEMSRQTLEQVDFDSHPDAISFRSRFNALAGLPSNFSGHYRLLFWGCGTECQQFSIVDVKTGQVFMDESWSTSLGVSFRPDSTLLITNPGARPTMRMKTGYYKWDGKQLQLLRP